MESVISFPCNRFIFSEFKLTDADWKFRLTWSALIVQAFYFFVGGGGVKMGDESFMRKKLIFNF